MFHAVRWDADYGFMVGHFAIFADRNLLHNWQLLQIYVQTWLTASPIHR
jgi:hypothetical protein